MTRLFRLPMMVAALIMLAGGTMAQNAGEPEISFDSLFAYGKQLVRTDPYSAIVILTKADSLIGEDNADRAALYRQLSNANYYIDNIDRALELNSRAIEIRNSLPSDSTNIYETAVLHYNNTLFHQRKNDYKQAQSEAEKAISLFDKIGNDYYVSIACDLGAVLYQQTGNIFRAQELALKELSVCEKMADTIGITYSYDLLAAICETVSQYDQQLQWQKKALELREMLNDSVQIALSYNNIGNTYINTAAPNGKSLDKAKIDTAIVYLKNALRLKRSFSEEQARRTEFSVASDTRAAKYWREKLLAGTLNNIAMAYRELNTDSCMAYGRLAAKYFKLLHDDYGYASALIVIAEGDRTASPQKRRQMFEEVVKLSNQNSDASFTPLLQKAYSGISEIYFKSGDYRNAYLTASESFRIKDSLTRESNIRNIAQSEMRFEFDKKRTADSVQHYHENLRLTAEHQQELRAKQLQTRIILCIAIVVLMFGSVFFFFYKTAKENVEMSLRQRMLETERSLLRTQMNPHFIFNALNSVQSFITSNNQLDAVRFLSKFAKLMRLILDHSMQQFVPLSDELTSLSLYIDLEKARFNNRFDYRIDIDDNVEEELVSVPPMLIQPFVENAILHGMMHKPEGGLITIKITDNGNNTLTCQITDNGVGRKAAAEIEKKGEKAHKSVGMQLTRERLQDLNRKTKSELSYTITDLEDSNGNALGTQVTIVIPEQE
ncbi:MAG: histidine kinase [Salinivirgaceae bacterium]|nr:histidine kinase [Salinivirgaceae bacterium]